MLTSEVAIVLAFTVSCIGLFLFMAGIFALTEKAEAFVMRRIL